MKVLFMGTPEFAVPSLEALVAAGHSVVAVLTQPDKPKGRGMQMAFSPVKECAIQYDIPVHQPETLRNHAIAPLLDELKPDVIAVVAYGKLLPGYVLRFPKYGCINVHSSLLPKYRGAAPMQAAVINGDTFTGVSTMYMAKALDAGDIIFSEVTPIDPDETVEPVHDRLMKLGASLLVKTLFALETGTAPRIPQAEEAVSYAPMLTRDDAELDWNLPARTLYNRTRGMTPWPGAWTLINGKMLKLFDFSMGAHSDLLPGSVRRNGDFLDITCGDGITLRCRALQPEGKRRMSVADYCNGRTLPERFGDTHA